MAGNSLYQDDVIVLRVKDWQTADRMAEGFTRAHGRILFIAYGVRHIRSRNSALVQSLTQANMQFAPGQKFDTLRQGELTEQLVAGADAPMLAYASFIAELTLEITPEREPQETIYLLLLDALKLLRYRNPRLVVLAFALKLFGLCGMAPNLEACVCCDRTIEGDAWISAVQGGCVCAACRTGAEAQFPATARALGRQLNTLDLAGDTAFTVKGRDLIVLEEFLYKFILTQVEKPLKSLQFLGGL